MNVFSRASVVANQSFDSTFCDDLLINGVPARGIVSPNPEALLGFGTQLLNGVVLSLQESTEIPLAVNSIVTHAGTEYVVIEPERSRDSMGWRKYLMSHR